MALQKSQRKKRLLMKKNSDFEMRKRGSPTSRSRSRKKDISKQKWKPLKEPNRKSRRLRSKSNSRSNKQECSRC
jgi:hypothetical protein